MLAPNSTLQQGRYRIIRHLSSGGMGAVYEAFDNRLQTKVAIKEALVSDAVLKRAFSKEALRLARLHHAALPNVSDHFTEYQRQYLVMRFIEGQDFADMLRKRGQPFPVAQVLAWGEQLLDVLAYLHSEGVIHRDIKPANIKLTPKGKLFLLDLGLAKGGLTQKTLAGMSLKGYTPGFAPPEQIRAQPTNEQSDLYSLAATLYALLTGETPEAASVRQRVIAHHVPDPLRPANELNPQVPAHIAQVLSQAMALNPADRPASAQAMRAMLNAPAASPSPQPTVQGSWRATLAQKWWQPALALFLLLLVVGAIWSFAGSNNPPTPETASEPQATEALVVVEVPTNTPSPTQTASQTPKSTETATQVPTQTASQTPKPTETATQTPTQTASQTPKPTKTATRVPTKTASQTPKPTETATQTPSVTTTPSPSPTIQLPALAGTPYPQPVAAISAENATQLTELARWGEGEVADGLTYSPDGKLLAAVRSDGIYLYDVQTLAVVHLLDTNDWADSIAFSPNGEIVAVDSDNNVQLWRVADGQLIATLTGHTSWVTSVSFSPDGLTLASGSSDETIRLWRVADGQLMATLTGHASYVNSVTFSPDGSMLASGSSDNTIRLWRMTLDGGQLTATLMGHTDGVRSVNFSPDGSMLASGSRDNTIRLWRMTLDGGQLTATLMGHTSWVMSVSFSPDGSMLASGSLDDTIRLWRITPDGGQLTATLTGHTGFVWSITFSPDGQLLASSNGETIRLWRVADGQLVATLTGHIDDVTSVGFSPDGQTLASSSCSKREDFLCVAGEVRLWRVADGQLTATLTGHIDDVTSVSFSPDGQLLASGSRDGTIRLWRMTPEGGQLMATLTGHASYVNSVTFSPDGSMLASGSSDNTIRLWRMTPDGGQLTATLTGHTRLISSINFSPDGLMLVSGTGSGGPGGGGPRDKTARLWRVADGQLMATLTRQASYVESITFSPDGQLLASGSYDGTIRLWGVGR